MARRLVNSIFALASLEISFRNDYSPPSGSRIKCFVFGV